MSNKKTLQDKFAEVKKFLEDFGATDEMIEFIADRAEKANRKSETRKPTATQVANAALAETILEYLKNKGERMQIAKMIKEIPELNGLFPQKVSALVYGLKKEGKVERTEEKGVAYFSAV